MNEFERWTACIIDFKLEKTENLLKTSFLFLTLLFIDAVWFNNSVLQHLSQSVLLKIIINDSIEGLFMTESMPPKMQ